MEFIARQVNLDLSLIHHHRNEFVLMLNALWTTFFILFIRILFIRDKKNFDISFRSLVVTLFTYLHPAARVRLAHKYSSANTRNACEGFIMWIRNLSDFFHVVAFRSH